MIGPSFAADTLPGEGAARKKRRRRGGKKKKERKKERKGEGGGKSGSRDALARNVVYRALAADGVAPADLRLVCVCVCVASNLHLVCVFERFSSLKKLS